MRVRVNIARWGISTAMRQNADRAERALAARMKTDMDPFVPSRSGRLRKAVRVEKNRIIYDSPHAGVNYRGYVLVDPDTGSPFARAGVRKVRGATSNRRDGRIRYSKAGTGAYWLSKARKANMVAWQRLVAKEVTHGLDKK